MRDLTRENADKYQDFFNFMTQEHNLTLTVSEMDEILYEAQALVKKLNKPDVEPSLLSCKNCNGYYGININHKCFKCLQSLF